VVTGNGDGWNSFVGVVGRNGNPRVGLIGCGAGCKGTHGLGGLCATGTGRGFRGGNCGCGAGVCCRVGCLSEGGDAS
jgi:hypothetical protein